MLQAWIVHMGTTCQC